MSEPKAPTPIFRTLKLWLDGYAASGAGDQRALHDFLICESKEGVDSLRSELLAISNGNYKLESLDVLLGKKRLVHFPTYEEWAKRMIVWMANYKP